MKKIYLIVYFTFLLLFPVSAQNLVADFTAEECMRTVYYQGFDSPDDMEGWTLQSTNADFTWHLGNPRGSSGVPKFSVINPDSKSSLRILYTEEAAQDEEYLSPEILLGDHQSMRFYTAFDGVYTLFANFKVFVVESDGVRTPVFDAYQYADENAHERAKWTLIEHSLSAWNGQTVRFAFVYSGFGGDDVVVDDFSIVEKTDDAMPVRISAGESVHFKNLSTGEFLSQQWSFEGGSPVTSDLSDPVVIYNEPGVYSVKLVISDGQNEAEVEKTHFVTVTGVAPKVRIGMPDEGYLSPYTGMYLPLFTDVTFHDHTQSPVLSRIWNFTNASLATSEEQHPVVSFSEEGIASVSLRVENEYGFDFKWLSEYFQVGGEQHIWNISVEENSQLASVPLGFFGYYGGSNWLGMEAFAEHFDAPSVGGHISEVELFFDCTTTISPEEEMTVSVVSATDGKPGEVLATSTLKLKELQSDPNRIIPTTFVFATPVLVENEFFITVSGFPNQSGDNGTDDVALLGFVRDDGEKCTAWHLLEEWDENYAPTGEYEWYPNVDSPLSLAIAPKFRYEVIDQGLSFGTADSQKTTSDPVCATVQSDVLQLYPGYEGASVRIYDMTGSLRFEAASAAETDLNRFAPGSYLLHLNLDGQSYRQLILIR